MSSASQFLTALAQAVSTMTLYGEGHPARERAIDSAYARLVDLQDEISTPSFTFLGDELVYNNRPLRELRGWDWGTRLSAAGVQRLEFVDRVSREDLEAFLDEVYTRLSGSPISTAEVRQSRPTNIRYGEVGLRGEGGEGEVRPLTTATLRYTLNDEYEGVEWLHEELKDRHQLHLLEAETIVRSLSVAMHGDQAFFIPLLRLKEFDEYTTTHAMNVSILTMALAEFLGLGPKEIRMFGIAGLLHDLGKVRVPDDILNKPGKLTDAERLVMNTHPVEGARIIMETEEHLDLAAVVAYEHHIRIDGGGYPGLKYPRTCHQASNLVHVCDVFDALRTHRPYRGAWEAPRILKMLEDGAGTEFEADIAHAFVQMFSRWESRVAEVGAPAEPLSIGATDSAPAGEGESGET